MHAAGFQEKKFEGCLLTYSMYTKIVGLGGVQLYNFQEKRQLEEERGQPSLGRPGRYRGITAGTVLKSR